MPNPVKPRILLVANYLPDGQKSMAAYAKLLERTLTSSGYVISLLTPTASLLPLGRKPKGIWKWVGYLDKFIIFPFSLRKISKDFDVVHLCDHSNAIYNLYLMGRLTVVTCHDVLAMEAARGLIPDWRVRFSGKFYQYLIFKGLCRSSSVVCVSEFTKFHLQKLGCPVKDISVALNPLNADFSQVGQSEIDEARVLAGIPNGARYFIHVGSDLARKNRFFLLKVFREMKLLGMAADMKLLLVGPALSPEMHEYAEKNNMTDSVITFQNAPHDMLKSLYAGAVALIFPSLHEGFGWPVIEAQACGCPVFASGVLPMTEVGGDAAIYFDPYDATRSARIILESLSQLGALKEKGFKNIERFSLQNFEKTYQTAYSRAIGVAHK